MAKLNKTLLYDSKIMKEVTLGRTKATALCQNVLAPASVKALVNEIKSENLFCSKDASNKGATKCFPIVLKYFDMSKGLKICLLDFYDDHDKSSKAVTAQILNKIESFKLDISRMTGYCAANASVNFGKHCSIFKKTSRKAT